MTHPTRRCLLPLVIAVCTGACAHQALIESDPPGAEVYVNGEKIGLTPVEIEDAPGWNRDYEITLRKDGYEAKQVTLTQDQWHVPGLVGAGCCGAAACGLPAIYFLPRSRTLLDHYNWALKRKDPLPPLSPPPAEPPPAVPPSDPAPAPAPAAPGGLTPTTGFKY
ncbi:MAG: PEGA domain-containing protein [Deltaproteobacteria bacterium]|nr:PEGA domain-containing protein [Deltaproteobacteria bacterium]